MVLCNLKLKLRCTPKKQFEKKRYVRALEKEEIRSQYETEIAHRIRNSEMEQMDMERKVNTLSEIIKQAVEATIPLAEQPRKKWISEQTLELAKEKRRTRLRVKESEHAVREYKRLCNARRDKQNWLEEQCENIEQIYMQENTKLGRRSN